MELDHLVSYCLLLVLIILNVHQSESAWQKRLFQKIDDLEFEVRKENVRRREEIRELRQSVDRLEEQLNNSLSILDKDDSEYSETETSRPQTETRQSCSGKIEEVLGAFKILKRGFSEEKKVTSRLRSHVTNIQSQLDEQRNVSRELSNGVADILEAVATMSDVLNNVKNDITDVKELGIIMSSEINNTNQKTSRIEETLHSDITDSFEVLKTNGMQIKVILNEGYKICKDGIRKLLNLQFYNCEEADRPKSCLEIFEAGCTLSAVYGISLVTGIEKVYCDQQTDGGGWLIFQRRRDGTVDFFRDWAEYKEGFGSLTGEFWLGNENIHRLLSSSKKYELRVDLGDFEGNTTYAKFSKFMIGPESDSYRLNIDGYSGNAGDSLKYHNGYTFKTKDRDRNDCSKNWKGGWWYGNCYNVNHNGVYWRQWEGMGYSIRFVEMKFREIS